MRYSPSAGKLCLNLTPPRVPAWEAHLTLDGQPLPMAYVEFVPELKNFGAEYTSSAVTDENGKFEMKNAPAGTYQLVSWHEATGWGPGGRDGNPITIKAGGETDVGKLEIK